MIWIAMIIGSIVAGRSIGKWAMVGLCGMVFIAWCSVFGGIGLGILTPKCAFDLASPPTRDGESNWTKATTTSAGERYVQLRAGDATLVFRASRSRLTYDNAGQARRLDATLSFDDASRAKRTLDEMRGFFPGATRGGWQATTAMKVPPSNSSPYEVTFVLQR